MVARAHTVAFEGIEVRPVDVQVQMTAGLPTFAVVGLPDKAVAESRERVRGALSAMGLALPPKRIVVNLAPADLPKEGSHYDLPIALAVLVALDILPADAISNSVALGELALDGTITAVAGTLPTALSALDRQMGLICPMASGPEAAWAGDDLALLAPGSLLALINHFRGTQVLSRPKPGAVDEAADHLSLADIKGQETAKRAIEIAAAGGHNLLMVGPPGSGKSMLAQRLPGLLPPLDPSEILEVTMIASLAGLIEAGALSQRRPFRNPHHSASMASLIGGGLRVRPGEVSLAHLGVLFLDELPEFSRQVLDGLRQPLETGSVLIARANAHVRYPARVQLVAAMNPCRCGYLADPKRGCGRAPKCAREYQMRISGPMIDRMDLSIDVPAVSAEDLTLPPPAEGSADVALRVARARDIQRARFTGAGPSSAGAPRTNAEVDGEALARIATPDAAGQSLLTEATSRLNLSARGYHRVLRVARTLADLDGVDGVRRVHVAEALSYRQAHSLGANG
jgi:magnesium chelatase family protein